MLYIIKQDDKVIEVTDQYKDGAESRRDWEDIATVEALATEATEVTGTEYIAVETGCWPRFDIVRAPQVDDAVSYGFNGDSYPAGFIKSISKTRKLITTTTGDKFYRRGNTGCWKMNGTWSLSQGHTDKRNPSF